MLQPGTFTRATKVESNEYGHNFHDLDRGWCWL